MSRILGTKRHPTKLGLAVTIVVFLVTFANNAGYFDRFKQEAVTVEPGLYTVTRFIDGDTVSVSMNGHEEKIRLIGVDTPETHKPNTPVQCYGPAAAAYTKTILTDQKIRLESDELSTDRDRYDRLLRYIYLADGRNFNEMLIQTGHGFYYPYFPFTKSKEFSAAQDSARAAHSGVWGNCTPTPTDKGGWLSNNQ
ncbi:MAG: thermonuclease family protein [Patescibacteria group bacterium]|nr:thermonuclease family protein [Patescibacteria group bacterium]